jgi:hypothetical protein
MDNLEKFILENSDKLNAKDPSPDLWNKIDKGLNNPPNGPSGTENATGTSAAGKLSTLAKIAIGGVATAVVGVGLFFALNGTGNTQTDAPVADDPIENPSTVWAPTLAEQYAEHIDLPDENVTPKYEEFVIDAATGGAWESKKGSVLNVPENAFVDADGNPVDGPVNLKYREFHDGPDIFFSGIPMKYTDEEGKVHDFQTAGMLELLGSKDGEPVYIADGKELDMSIASPTDEPRHRTWYLNPENGNWEDRGEHEIVKNVEKAAAIAALPPLPAKPVKPKTVGEAENMFDFGVNYDRFPELKAYKSITWEFTDLEQFEENQWIYEVAWANGELEVKDEQKNEYWLTLTKGRKTYKAAVTPVLKGEDYQTALTAFNEAQQNYATLLAQRELEEGRVGAQSDFARQFGINQLGIWNCDRLNIPPTSMPFSIDVEFEKDTYVDKGQCILFHFTNSSRSVMPYAPNAWRQFRFDPEMDNALVAVLPNGQYALFSDKEFRKLDLVKAKKEKALTLNMQTIEEPIRSPIALRKHLGM